MKFKLKISWMKIISIKNKKILRKIYIKIQIFKNQKMKYKMKLFWMKKDLIKIHNKIWKKIILKIKILKI